MNSSSGVPICLVLTSLSRTSGGGHAFARGLVGALSEDGGIDLALVLPRGADLEDLAIPVDTRVVLVRPLNGWARILRDLAMAQRWARVTTSDIIVVPHEWGVPSRRTAVVNVIQNVVHMHPASRSNARTKSWLMRLLARVTAPTVDTSIAVAPSVRDMWQRLTGLNSVVLPEGVSQLFASAASPIRENSIVIVTGQAPHKNATLAKDVAADLKRLRSDISIRFVGLEPHDALPEVRSDGLLPPPALAELFGQSRVVVVTSTVESFGLPAFEARAAGSRVVVMVDTPMAEWLEGDPMVYRARPDRADVVRSVLAALGASGQHLSSRSFDWSSVGPQWSREIARSVPVDARKRSAS